MTDLAQAIVDLGKAAQARKHASRALAESTSTVAAAIRKQLRSLDDITICRGPSGQRVGMSQIPGPHCPPGSVGYMVMRFARADGRPQQVLTRDGSSDGRPDIAVLEELDLPPDQPLVCLEAGADNLDCHRATTFDRLDFAREAAAVIAEFKLHLEGDAEELLDAAQNLTKLAVR